MPFVGNFSLTNRKNRAIIVTLVCHGLVAQLGAHHIRIVGVEGSNPFKSTITHRYELFWFKNVFCLTIENAER